MVGQSSLTHNSRTFKAKNIKEDYTQHNIEYCNENIKTVYHELFEKALETAKKILYEFMKNFQQGNKNLRVFSAHLHMDEETPYLHIDFVPLVTVSKRGLATRVSLKKVLTSLGFEDGTKQDTERSQWIASEKRELGKVMECHNVIWKQKGIHEKHLSVLDFEKQEREKEVQILRQTRRQSGW